MRTRHALAVAALFVAASTSAAFAETWTLLVQPAPYSQTPPPYSSWQPYQQYGDLESCLLARGSLHWSLWSSDQDLSMRVLSGACRSDATGEIVTKGKYDEDEEDW